MTEYKSGGYGYIPHYDQTLAECPKCGCTLFKTRPQSVPANAKVWCWEHICTNCGHGLAIEVER